MKQLLSIVVLSVLAVAVPIRAAEIETATEEPTVKWADVKPEQIRLNAGDEMYRALCSVCHGTDGKGAGPAAVALPMYVPDLTLLAAANNGKFPAIETLNEILRDREIAAHGNREMPIWGDIFRVTTSSPAMARHSAWVLMKYVESIQVPEELERPS